MTFGSEATQATGHLAIDEHGTKVGRITDVLYDRDGEPRWAVVDPGPLRRSHYAPLRGAYGTERGDVVLPVDGQTVKHAPAATREHVLTRDLEQELVRHYGHDFAPQDDAT